MNPFQMPEWLEAWRVPDRLQQEAYEKAAPTARAALKTALALTTFIIPPSSEITHYTQKSIQYGFWEDRKEYPVEWTLIVFNASFDAAARICAACALPRLAHVQHIIAICINGLPSLPALTALELAGIEEIFQLTQSQLERFLLDNRKTHGRVIILHSGQLAETVSCCARMSIPFYNHSCEPRLYLESPESFSPEILSYMQGFIPHSATSMTGSPDAIYVSSITNGQRHGARLVLTPGTEGYWTFPNLDASFFKICTSAFGLLEGERDVL